MATTIFNGGSGDQNLYLRPMTYDPEHRRWGQKNSYYIFNNKCKTIGSGSMGIVYLCNEYRNADDLVAVKVVWEKFSNNPRIRQRAKQEASMSFVHDNVIEMLGFCEYRPTDGPLLILSRYFKGENIDKYIQKLTDSEDRVKEICRLMIQTLKGLDYIHSFKITHRDVKPSNIMVNQQGQVKLMDLGIARVNGGNKFSAIGFVGTPEYASPEQIRGEDSLVGTYTDIYSVGVTFYELLTGNNPFKDSSDVVTMDNQLNKKLQSDSSIPSGLMRIIRKATEKEFSKRYQTAEEFREAIENYLNTPDSFWNRLLQWLKK